MLAGPGNRIRVGLMGALDADAIAGVREEAWPRARSADEVHEALMTLGAITAAEAHANEHWDAALATLAYDCRRPDYFRPQLMDALRIVQRGDLQIDEMLGGDWAGELVPAADELAELAGLLPELVPEQAARPGTATAAMAQAAIRPGFMMSP